MDLVGTNGAKPLGKKVMPPSPRAHDRTLARIQARAGKRIRKTADVQHDRVSESHKHWSRTAAGVTKAHPIATKAKRRAATKQARKQRRKQ